MKYVTKQHRKKVTKLQKGLRDIAETNLLNGVSIKQTADRLNDSVTFWRSQNPTRKEQTYVTIFDLSECHKTRGIYIRDAGQDATIISIVEEE
jgi:hypothetical protein